MSTRENTRLIARGPYGGGLYRKFLENLLKIARSDCSFLSNVIMISFVVVVIN